MSLRETFNLPATEFVDITPELLAEIVPNLPPHEEGHFAVTVRTGSFARLLEAAGAKVVRGYHQTTNEGGEDVEETR